MANSKITWNDKVSLVTDPTIAEINKVTDSNMNEIKNVVNENADELTEKIVYDEDDITENTGLIIEEVPEGSNIPYINSEIAIGSTNEDNRPTWFKQSDNIFGAIPSTQTKNGITLTNNGDGTFNLVGTATAQTEFIWWKNYTEFESKMKQNAPWRSYVNKNSDNVIYQISTWTGTTSSPVWSSTPIQFTQTQTNKIISTGTFGSLVRFNIQVNSGATINLTNIQVSLVLTDKAITYNKYLGYSSININGNDEYYKNIYSTEEQVIGTWLGKPLYRKVIDFGALPNATTKAVAHNISNIDKIVKIDGITYSNQNYSPLPLVYNSSEAQYNTEIYVGGTNISMKSTQNRSSVTAFVYLEYTKTTD